MQNDSNCFLLLKFEYVVKLIWKDVELFRKLKRQKNTISETIVKQGGRVLFIPKAIRYFISAVPFDLERPNTIQLRVSDEYYHIVHSTLNSNLFYWWWRVNGNGFRDIAHVAQ